MTKKKITDSKNYKWWVLGSVAIGTFMAPLDSSVVNIVLPQIAGYFKADMASIEWVIMSYLLVISSLLLESAFFNRLITTPS